MEFKPVLLLKVFKNDSLKVPQNPLSHFNKHNHPSFNELFLDRKDALDNKYHDYKAWEVNIPHVPGLEFLYNYQVIPNKSLFIARITFTDTEYVLSQIVQYETIVGNLNNGIITYNDNELEALPSVLWKQMGDITSDVIILLKLNKFISINDSDNIKKYSNTSTYELYPYLIARVIVLRKI